MIRVTTPGTIGTTANRQEQVQNRKENHNVKICKQVLQHE